MKSQVKCAVAFTALAGVFALSTSNQALAAGFEKSVFWDAHYAALAGAAQSSVVGPQALLWNPAALAGPVGLQINGNISPTWAMFSGPMVLNSNTVQNSNTKLLPVGGAFVSYGITPQWGIGVGYYVVAGNSADYDSVQPGSLAALGISYAPPLKGDLSATELSVGTGYEILPGLKLGAAYRMTFVNATLDTQGTVQPLGTLASTTLVSTQINNISQTRSGLRVGLEYAPKDSPWGFGVVYRNQVQFAANGTASVTTASTGTFGAPSGTSAGTGENVIVSLNLPQRVDTSVHYQLVPAITLFAGYTFINTSQDQTLGIAGVSASTLGGPLSASATSVPLNWNNQHLIRFATEFAGLADWPIRVGYVWVSQVTPVGNALPILTAPGTGNSIIAGTGHKFSSNLTLDGAFEYSWDSGTVSSTDNPAPTTAVGNYTAKAYVVHLSGTYAF